MAATSGSVMTWATLACPKKLPEVKLVDPVHTVFGFLFQTSDLRLCICELRLRRADGLVG